MNFTRIYALFLRQIYLMMHTPMRFMNMFMWGILDILVWGFLTTYLDSVQQLEFSFVPLLLGAVILWNFLIRVQQGVILAFLEDVWSRNFLNLFASPLRIKEYVGGLVATSIIASITVFAVLLTVAALILDYNILSVGTSLIAFLIILFLFGVALGIIAAGLGLRYGPSAEWVAWMIPFVIMPFSSVYYPISALPDFLEPVARILPTAYAFEGMRTVLLEDTFIASHALTGAALGVAYLLLAYIFFVRIYKKALRTGLIARYSAETLSA